MNSPKSKPWYKQPLVWLVIAFPATAVVAGFITLSIAIKTDDGVVVDDYYKKGKEINRVLTRDKEAADLGLRGHVAYNPENREIMIFVESNQNVTLPDQVRIQLLHATRGKIDIDEQLTMGQPGNYPFSLPDSLAQGGWIVQVSTPAWRIHGRIDIPGSYSGTLAPL